MAGSDSKLSIGEGFSVVIRQLTTPIAVTGSLALACLTVFPWIISRTNLEPGYMGWLLSACLACGGTGFLIIVALAIFFPKNLTFDKDAHLVGVSVEKRQVPDLVAFATDLPKLSNEDLEHLAGQIRADETSTVPTPHIGQQRSQTPETKGTKRPMRRK